MSAHIGDQERDFPSLFVKRKSWVDRRLKSLRAVDQNRAIEPYSPGILEMPAADRRLWADLITRSNFESHLRLAVELLVEVPQTLADIDFEHINWTIENAGALEVEDIENGTRVKLKEMFPDEHQLYYFMMKGWWLVLERLVPRIENRNPEVKRSIREIQDYFQAAYAAFGWTDERMEQLYQLTLETMNSAPTLPLRQFLQMDGTLQQTIGKYFLDLQADARQFITNDDQAMAALYVLSQRFAAQQEGAQTAASYEVPFEQLSSTVDLAVIQTVDASQPEVQAIQRMIEQHPDRELGMIFALLTETSNVGLFMELAR